MVAKIISHWMIVPIQFSTQWSFRCHQYFASLTYLLTYKDYAATGIFLRLEYVKEDNRVGFFHLELRFCCSAYSIPPEIWQDPSRGSAVNLFLTRSRVEFFFIKLFAGFKKLLSRIVSDFSNIILWYRWTETHEWKLLFSIGGFVNEKCEIFPFSFFCYEMGFNVYICNYPLIYASLPHFILWASWAQSNPTFRIRGPKS